jgi:hypothetical protein
MQLLTVKSDVHDLFAKRWKQVALTPQGILPKQSVMAMS